MLKQSRTLLQTSTLIAVSGLIAGGALFLRPAHLRGRSATLSFQDNFTSGNLNQWEMPYPEDWEIVAGNGLSYLHMKRPRPAAVPRRPVQFARLRNVRVGSFDLEARVRREQRSIIVVFNYVDTLHFYYVHLSRDRGASIAVHNGIFIVNGAPRRRIAGKLAPAALPDLAWHTVRIVRDVRSGSMKIFMDGQKRPLFTATDRTFTCGQIGLGSFDEVGDFTDVRLRSNDANCSTTPER